MKDLRKNILSNRLPKGVLFEKSKAHGFHRSIKGSLTETALPKRFLQGQFFLHIFQDGMLDLGTDLYSGSAKAHTACLCSVDPLSLPLLDVFPFVFGRKGQNLQYEIRDESSQ